MNFGGQSCGLESSEDSCIHMSGMWAGMSQRLGLGLNCLLVCVFSSRVAWLPPSVVASRELGLLPGGSGLQEQMFY